MDSLLGARISDQKIWLVKAQMLSYAANESKETIKKWKIGDHHEHKYR